MSTATAESLLMQSRYLANVQQQCQLTSSTYGDDDRTVYIIHSTGRGVAVDKISNEDESKNENKSDLEGGQAAGVVRGTTVADRNLHKSKSTTSNDFSIIESSSGKQGGRTLLETVPEDELAITSDSSSSIFTNLVLTESLRKAFQCSRDEEELDVLLLDGSDIAEPTIGVLETQMESYRDLSSGSPSWYHFDSGPFGNNSDSEKSLARLEYLRHLSQSSVETLSTGNNAPLERHHQSPIPRAFREAFLVSEI